MSWCATSPDFDLRYFLEHARATKPPYSCPYTECKGKVYRTFTGLQTHFTKQHASEMDKMKQKHTSVTSSAQSSVGRERLESSTDENSPKITDLSLGQRGSPWTQSQKIVEVDYEGRLWRLNILEPLEVVSVIDSELSPNSKWDAVLHNYKSAVTLSQQLPEAKYRPVDECHRTPTKQTKPPPPLLHDVTPSPHKHKSGGKLQPEQTYIRYVEKSPGELDLEVEYDMDEEDYAWLELVNNRRAQSNLPKVAENDMEFLLDRLEKESHFQSLQTTPPGGVSSGVKRGVRPLVDEDAACCVCQDAECQNTNVILFCDMCNLAVHQECYGIPYIPEGQWLCRRCQLSPSLAVDCCLCPNKGGAFKQTSDGRWAHVICAIWVPEVHFANTVFLEPVEGLGTVPPARWKLKCIVCKQRGVGASIQCHKPSCYAAFHVTCAQSAGLYMRVEPAPRGCPSPTGGAYGVRKFIYCDMHAPAHSDIPAMDEDAPNGGNAKNGCSTTEESGGGCGEKSMQQRKQLAAEKLKKARKLLLRQRRNSAPNVSIPVIPPQRYGMRKQLVAEKLKKARKLLLRQRRNSAPNVSIPVIPPQRYGMRKQLVAEKLKKARKLLLRQRRNSAPNVSIPVIPPQRYGMRKQLVAEKLKKARKLLLRQRRNSAPNVSIPVIPPQRLETVAAQVKMTEKESFMERLVAYWTLKRESRFGVPLLRRLQVFHQPRNTSLDELGGSHGGGTTKKRNKKAGKKWWSEKGRKQVKVWRRLRQDLERVRLLCELMRKREKLKLEYACIAMELIESRLKPLTAQFVDTIDRISAKDRYRVFANPVQESEVPGYHGIIIEPMDLYTMRTKAEKGKYSQWAQIWADFKLMIDNCSKFNQKNTFFWKYGLRMRRLGNKVIKTARQNYESSQQTVVSGGKQEDSLQLFGGPLELVRKCDETAPWPGAGIIEKNMETTPRNETKIEIGGSEEKMRPLNLSPLFLEEERIEDDEEVEVKLKPGRKGLSGNLKEEKQRRKKPVSKVMKSQSIKEASFSQLKTSPKASAEKKKKISVEADPRLETSADSEEFQILEIAQEEKKTNVKSSAKKKIEIKKEWETVFLENAELANSGSKFGVGDKKKRGLGEKSSDFSTGVGPVKSRKVRSDKGIKRKIDTTTTSGGPSTKKRKLATPKPNASFPDEAAGDQRQASILEFFASPSAAPGVNRRTAVLHSKKAKPKKADQGLDEDPGTPPVLVAEATPSTYSRKPSPAAAFQQFRNTEPVVVDPKSPLSAQSGDSSTTTTTDDDDFLTSDDSDNNEEGGFRSSLTSSVSTRLRFSTFSQTARKPTGKPIGRRRRKKRRKGRVVEEIDLTACPPTLAEEASTSKAPANAVDSDEGTIMGLVNPDPMDLVWAQTDPSTHHPLTHHPTPYPALVIDKAMPRSGYWNKGVEIHAPPEWVLDKDPNKGQGCDKFYLVRFFDDEFSWGWVRLSRMQYFGLDPALDQRKLSEAKKPVDKTNLQKAFDKAQRYRSVVTDEFLPELPQKTATKKRTSKKKLKKSRLVDSSGSSSDSDSTSDDDQTGDQSKCRVS